jgi:hypothetical protein
MFLNNQVAYICAVLYVLLGTCISAKADDAPQLPSPLQHYENHIRKQAGVGSDIPYARRGVLELGGGLTWLVSERGMNLTLSPTIGWFLSDNFEMSALVQLSHYRIALTHEDTEDHENTFVTGLIEPSLHIPIADAILLFGGVGLGATYETEHSHTGLALAPRLGLNALIGRSGVLSPSISWNWSSNHTLPTPQGTLLAVNSTYSANMSYTVMW